MAGLIQRAIVHEGEPSDVLPVDVALYNEDGTPFKGGASITDVQVTVKKGHKEEPTATGTVSGTTLTLEFDGLQGETGPQGKQGPTGEKGTDGKDGADGADGKQGPAGPQGAKGDDGVGVKSIKLTLDSDGKVKSGTWEKTAGGAEEIIVETESDGTSE